MKTRHYLWRLLCYSPWLCLGSLILSVACYTISEILYRISSVDKI